MSRTDIKVRVLKEVIADLGQEFATKDVSEDKRMIKAHPIDSRHSLYHAFVGGAISDNRGILNIKEVKKGTKRGSIWRKI
jgi:hypothetical protein